MSTISLKNVSYQYKKGDRKAVNDVTCEFHSGELVALTGPSGSGKSTLLSLIAGLDRPQEGIIALDDISLTEKDLDSYRRNEISMIFQSFQLFPLLTVLENVCYPMELNGTRTKEAKPVAEELLQSVGIGTEKYKRFPANLSGGEQQRVAIARALASGSKVLLADEPTGNLDVENTEIIMDILERLSHEQDYCVIIVTHDLEIAKRADITYRLVDGALQCQ